MKHGGTVRTSTLLLVPGQPRGFPVVGKSEELAVQFVPLTSNDVHLELELGPCPPLGTEGDEIDGAEFRAVERLARVLRLLLALAFGHPGKEAFLRCWAEQRRILEVQEDVAGRTLESLASVVTPGVGRESVPAPLRFLGDGRSFPAGGGGEREAGDAGCGRGQGEIGKLV